MAKTVTRRKPKKEFTLDDVYLWLTNGTMDAVLNNSKALRDLGLPFGDDNYPLTEQELQFLNENHGQLVNAFNNDIMGGHSVIIGRKKFHAVSIELHFRNDATRHVWGTPATFETDLPSRDSQTEQAKRFLECVKKKADGFDGFTCLSLDQYEKTKDRHILWVFIPFDWIVKNFKESKLYDKFLVTLCHGPRQ